MLTEKDDKRQTAAEEGAKQLTVAEIAAATRPAAHEQPKQARKLMAAEEHDRRSAAAEDGAIQPTAAAVRKLMVTEKDDKRQTAAEEGAKQLTVAKIAAATRPAAHKQLKQARKLMAAEE